MEEIYDIHQLYQDSIAYSVSFALWRDRSLEDGTLTYNRDSGEYLTIPPK